MDKTLVLKIILPSELDEIIAFEKRKLAEAFVDEAERSFQEWQARWRKESLEHYLPLGWSFLARDRDEQGPLLGYFIAQPLLFFDGQTQALWVEHLQYNSLQVRDELCLLAYKLAREKHLQRVYFPNTSSILNAVRHLHPEPWQANMLMLKTTKV